MSHLLLEPVTLISSQEAHQAGNQPKAAEDERQHFVGSSIRTPAMRKMKSIVTGTCGTYSRCDEQPGHPLSACSVLLRHISSPAPESAKHPPPPIQTSPPRTLNRLAL